MKVLLVPRMKAPDDCRECPFSDYNLMTYRTVCIVSNKELAKERRTIPFDGIPEWCELREIDVTPDRD